MNTQLQIHNKTLISHRKSRRSIQSFKTLGISKRKFYSEEEIINLYKENRYGLSSAIFCRNVKKALELAKKINTVRVIINSDTLDIHPLIPWGGIK